MQLVLHVLNVSAIRFEAKASDASINRDGWQLAYLFSSDLCQCPEYNALIMECDTDWILCGAQA